MAFPSDDFFIALSDSKARARARREDEEKKKKRKKGKAKPSAKERKRKRPTPRERGSYEPGTSVVDLRERQEEREPPGPPRKGYRGQGAKLFRGDGISPAQDKNAERARKELGWSPETYQEARERYWKRRENLYEQYTSPAERARISGTMAANATRAYRNALDEHAESVRGRVETRVEKPQERLPPELLSSNETVEARERFETKKRIIEDLSRPILDEEGNIVQPPVWRDRPYTGTAPQRIKDFDEETLKEIDWYKKVGTGWTPAAHGLRAGEPVEFDEADTIEEVMARLEALNRGPNFVDNTIQNATGVNTRSLNLLPEDKREAAVKAIRDREYNHDLATHMNLLPGPGEGGGPAEFFFPYVMSAARGEDVPWYGLMWDSTLLIGSAFAPLRAMSGAKTFAHALRAGKTIEEASAMAKVAFKSSHPLWTAVTAPFKGGAKAARAAADTRIFRTVAGQVHSWDGTAQGFLKRVRGFQPIGIPGTSKKIGPTLGETGLPFVSVPQYRDWGTGVKIQQPRSWVMRQLRDGVVGGTHAVGAALIRATDSWEYALSKKLADTGKAHPFQQGAKNVTAKVGRRLDKYAGAASQKSIEASKKHAAIATVINNKLAQMQRKWWGVTNVPKKHYDAKGYVLKIVIEGIPTPARRRLIRGGIELAEESRDKYRQQISAELHKLRESLIDQGMTSGQATETVDQIRMGIDNLGAEDALVDRQGAELAERYGVGIDRDALAKIRSLKFLEEETSGDISKGLELLGLEDELAELGWVDDVVEQLDDGTEALVSNISSKAPKEIGQFLDDARNLMGEEGFLDWLERARTSLNYFPDELAERRLHSVSRIYANARPLYPQDAATQIAVMRRDATNRIQALRKATKRERKIAGLETRAQGRTVEALAKDVEKLGKGVDPNSLPPRLAQANKAQKASVAKRQKLWTRRWRLEQRRGKILGRTEMRHGKAVEVHGKLEDALTDPNFDSSKVRELTEEVNEINRELRDVNRELRDELRVGADIAEEQRLAGEMMDEINQGMAVEQQRKLDAIQTHRESIVQQLDDIAEMDAAVQAEIDEIEDAFTRHSEFFANSVNEILGAEDAPILGYYMSAEAGLPGSLARISPDTVEYWSRFRGGASAYPKANVKELFDDAFYRKYLGYNHITNNFSTDGASVLMGQLQSAQRLSATNEIVQWLTSAAGPGTELPVRAGQIAVFKGPLRRAPTRALSQYVDDLNAHGPAHRPHISVLENVGDADVDALMNQTVPDMLHVRYKGVEQYMPVNAAARRRLAGVADWRNPKAKLTGADLPAHKDPITGELFTRDGPTLDVLLQRGNRARSSVELVDKNVVWVDEGIVIKSFEQQRNALPQEWERYARSAAKKNLAGNVFDAIGDAQKAFILYMKPSYVTANLSGNLVAHMMQAGMLAPAALGKSVLASRKLPAMYVAFADELVESGFSGILNPRTGFGTGPGASAIARNARASLRNVAKSAQWLTDQFPRRAAFFHELRRDGYRSLDDIRKLMDRAWGGEEEALEILGRAGQRGAEAMVTFNRMNAFERNVVSRFILFYPWMKGAARYTIKFPFDHPVQAAAYGYLGNEWRKTSNEDLGDRRPYQQPVGSGIRIKVPLTDKVIEARLPDGKSVNPVQVLFAAQTAEDLFDAWQVLRGDHGVISGRLHPIFGGLLELATGREPFDPSRQSDRYPLSAPFGPLTEPPVFAQQIMRAFQSDEERAARNEFSTRKRSRSDDIVAVFFGGSAPFTYDKKLELERWYREQVEKGKVGPEEKRKRAVVRSSINAAEYFDAAGWAMDDDTFASYLELKVKSDFVTIRAEEIKEGERPFGDTGLPETDRYTDHHNLQARTQALLELYGAETGEDIEQIVEWVWSLSARSDADRKMLNSQKDALFDRFNFGLIRKIEKALDQSIEALNG